MKFFVQLSFLGVLLLIFSGCTPKISIKTLQAPQIINPNTKKMAVIPFENDTIGQTQAIINELNSIYIDGIKYYTLLDQSSIDTLIQEKKLGNVDSFRVYSGSTQAKSILIGKVLEQNISYYNYVKEDIDYDYCIKFEHTKDRDKRNERKCVKYATFYIPCTKQTYDVTTNIQVINIEDSSILFSKNYTSQDSYSTCQDVRYVLPNPNRVFSKLTNKIAQNFMSDITPTHRYISIETIDSLDIKATKPQEQQFEKAIDAIENNNIPFAKDILDQLNIELSNSSATVLYNLGLCYEALGDKDTANSIYTLAMHKSIEYNSIIDQAVKRTADQLYLEKEIQPLLTH